jgi:hypothetical protein
MMSEDIMLMDDQLLCHELARNPKTNSIPVTIFSEVPSPKHPALSSNLGIKACYDKTQNGPTLLKNILQLIH